eukprot:g23563.t1
MAAFIGGVRSPEVRGPAHAVPVPTGIDLRRETGSSGSTGSRSRPPWQVIGFVGGLANGLARSAKVCRAAESESAKGSSAEAAAAPAAPAAQVGEAKKPTAAESRLALEQASTGGGYQSLTADQRGLVNGFFFPDEEELDMDKSMPLEECDAGKRRQGQLCFQAPKGASAELKALISSFRPSLTPKEVLHLGAFGGTYFRDIDSAELPKSWLKGLDIRRQVARDWEDYDATVNHYGVKCGNTLEETEHARFLGKRRVDASARPVWLVPVVLPLLSGAAKRGRPTPDQALVEDLRPDRPMERKPHRQVREGESGLQ